MSSFTLAPEAAPAIPRDQPAGLAAARSLPENTAAGPGTLTQTKQAQSQRKTNHATPPVRMVRWRDMTAKRIVRVGPTYIATPPVFRSSFPPESQLKDDVCDPMGLRVEKAIQRRLLSKWYTSDQLALIPSGTASRAPPVTVFDRANVMICHDQETDLVNQITDVSQPLPPASEFHLAQVYLELPITLPHRPADAVAGVRGAKDLELDKQYPFSYAWLPGERAPHY